MVLNAGNLNRRIQVRRFTKTGKDSFGGNTGEWNDLGPLLFAQRRDVSDAERFQAGAIQTDLITRFTIRASAFAREIRRSDRLVHDGLTFKIDGIKEVPHDRRFLEITANTSEAK